MFRKGYIEGPVTRIKLTTWVWKNETAGSQVRKVRKVRSGTRKEGGMEERREGEGEVGIFLGGEEWMFGGDLGVELRAW